MSSLFLAFNIDHANVWVCLWNLAQSENVCETWINAGKSMCLHCICYESCQAQIGKQLELIDVNSHEFFNCKIDLSCWWSEHESPIKNARRLDGS